MGSLGKILTGDGIADKLEVLFDDVANNDLLQDVGTGAFPLVTKTASASNPKLSIFDTTLSVSADAGVTVGIEKDGTTFDPFGDGVPFSAPAGNSYAQIDVTGKLSASGNFAFKALPLKLSASAAAGLTYLHLLPVVQTETRLAAFRELVATAQLPQFRDLRDFVPDEVTRFQGTFNLDLGLKASFGSTFNFDETLKIFNDLPAQAQAEITYTLEASLGWSVFEELAVTMAGIKDGRVRIRIDRSAKDSFTFGATFSLQVDYDASSIASVLEQALKTTPLPRAIDVLTTLSNGDWDTVKQKITDKASTALIDAIAGTGWEQAAANSPLVQNFLTKAQDIVRIYDSIPAKVQQLWGDLLVRADLGPDSKVRQALGKIASIDVNSLKVGDFLSADWQKHLDLLESLTGVSLEDLILGSDGEVKKAITKAVDLATKAQDLLNGVPDEVTQKINAWAKSNGITSAIQFISQHDTLAELQAAGDKAIEDVVSKLVGKAFDQVDPADYAKVQAFAKKLLAKIDQLDAALKKAVNLLKGSIGFSVGVEISRVTEVSAVLDLELDPDNDQARTAVAPGLRTGNVQNVLANLAAIEAGANGALPFTIREAVLISRHLRSSAASTLLSLAGLLTQEKVVGTRIDETIVRISDTGRKATYSGGFLQAVQNDAAKSSESGAWLVSRATDDSIDPFKPYDTVEKWLRLTFSRKDDDMASDELASFSNLLGALGFTGGNTGDVPSGAETVLTVDILLDSAALDAIAATSDPDWNGDYRNAALQLFRGGFVSSKVTHLVDPDDPNKGSPTEGEVLAFVVKTSLFDTNWVDSSMTRFRNAFIANGGIAFNGEGLRFYNPNKTQAIPPYVPIQNLVKQRPVGLGTLGDLRTAIQAAADRKPSSLEKLARSAATTFARTNLSGYASPLFNFWFVIACLFRSNRDVLKGAKGLATLRFRTDPNADLSDPITWSLQDGQGIRADFIEQRKLFPFPPQASV